MKVVLVAVVCLVALGGIPQLLGASYEPLLALQAGPVGPENSGLLKYTDGFYYGVSKSGGSYGYGTLYRSNEAGEVTVLVHFSGNNGNAKGRRPQCGLMDDGHGNLWGTTLQGGVGNFGTGFGTVFRFNPVTWDFTSVVAFTGTSGFAKGSFPQGGVQKDDSGQIWGTTSGGGAGGNGTIFKIGSANLVFSHVLDFSGTMGGNRGKAPISELRWDDNLQSFYGSTSEGGENGQGTLFRFSTTANQLLTLADFTGDSGAVPGSKPKSGLMPDSAGFWWGTTSAGGSHGFGTVYRLEANGGGFTSVASFTGASGNLPGKSPASGLSADPSGNGILWGTTSGGGAGDYGTFFKIDSKLLTVNSFKEFSGSVGPAAGQMPTGGLAQDGTGGFWGTTGGDGVAGLGGVFRIDSASGEIRTIKNFTKTLGSASPSDLGAGLIAGPDGQFWGTSEKGGAANLGTVYTFNPVTGLATTVVEFTGNSGSVKGREPSSELMLDNKGVIWGTTVGGGVNDCGIVFKINGLTKVFTPVVEFTGTDGKSPSCRLVADASGILWGTTAGGGVGDAGTIFRLNPTTGVMSPMVQFTGTAGSFLGDGPAAGLVADGNGWFWGTTYEGGNFNLGTVFKYHPASGSFESVASFTGGSGAFKGDGPATCLTRDAEGNFWGTTGFGGTDDLGTVFKINGLTHLFTTMAEFTGPTGDLVGANPGSNLVQDPTGAWYGTTKSGGADGLGTLWRIAPDGSLSTLCEFTGVTGLVPGERPDGMLFKHTDGNFYGVTQVGGAVDQRTPAGNGQIFRLRMGPTQVTTLGAQVTVGVATLSASVNANGTAGLTYFEYGTSPALVGATATPVAAIGAGNVAEPLSVQITGLLPSTRYYYRVKATNPENAKVQSGAVLSFMSSAPDGGGTGNGPGFVAWLNAAGIPGGGAEAGNDPDGDGVASALEFILGGNPALRDSVAMPWIEVTSTHLVFRFSRRDESETADAHLTVEAGYGPGTWVAGYDVGSSGAVSSEGVTVEENGTAPDLVTVSIPRASGLKFARLKVVISP